MPTRQASAISGGSGTLATARRLLILVPRERLTPELGDIRFNGERRRATLVHGITVALPGSVGPGARAATSLLDGYPRAVKCSLSDSSR